MGTLLRLATAGSVDDGKSTLVGRLLHDSRSVLADQLDAVERVSRERGLGATDLALLTDGLRAEREQGITIDVAYRYFATANRSFVLADCPGHVQYTRNTVTGSSTADALVLLVDARRGVLEQTRRHLAVAALMRVPHVVIAVNKIDLVQHSEEVFRAVAADVRRIAADLGVTHAHAVPVSALHGDNVVERSAGTPWYDGPSLLELLESLPAGGDPATEPFRMPVQLVIRPQSAARSDEHVEYRGYAGQVSSGVVRVGDEVVVQPSGTRSRVTGIDLGDRRLDVAVAAQSVTVRLADDVDVSRGDVLVAADDVAPLRQEVPALVCWLGDTPLRPGARVLVKHGARTVLALVRTVDGRLDLDTLRLVEAEGLALNDIGRVTVRLASALPVEPYARSRRGGAFLVIDPDDGRTLAAAMADASLRRGRRAVSLPLALDLRGQRVVAVGGGPVSARRVTAFADEGALVEVVSPWLCEELAGLVADGAVAWTERDYAGPDDLDGAWLVHTATGDLLVDSAVREDAQRARVWCVDATDAACSPAAVPARHRVTTPDGTLTVAVHAGGDPALARDVAREVARVVATGGLDLRRRRARTGPGWVALVGGGPGPGGLLTARGHEVLAAADVVVVDRLAPRELVDALPAWVRVVDVGKSPGHHAMPQDRINDLLVEEALAGHGVVRLKGGDPYVFGRGGEERLACEAHGVRVEVVPGVTSAVAVPAAAGIPVTHRGLSRGFTVVTGHDELPAVPPGSGHTVVLLMGVSALRRSAEALVAAGRSRACPAAVVASGWQPGQRTTLGTLADIADRAEAAAVANPAVVVVGDVVRLAPGWAARRDG